MQPALRPEPPCPATVESPALSAPLLPPFYSRGRPDENGHVRFPVNVEMNINHEYWHLRDDDPTALDGPGFGPSRLDIKFSFANCLDDGNEIHVEDAGYVPDIDFHNLSWADHLTKDRLPLIAGWAKNNDEL